jgi:hypothetical protein
VREAHWNEVRQCFGSHDHARDGTVLQLREGIPTDRVSDGWHDAPALSVTVVAGLVAATTRKSDRQAIGTGHPLSTEQETE